MSINRSEVRKSALTLLYAIRENGGKADEFDFDLFWSIAQEKKTDKLRESHARAILHTCRASGESAELLGRTGAMRPIRPDSHRAGTGRL